MITEPWKEGFYEVEVHRVVQQFGNLAHVWSTYEMRNSPDGAAFDRGIKTERRIFSKADVQIMRKKRLQRSAYG